MKTIVILGILILLLADTFFLWCLLRANAIQEQNELHHLKSREEAEKSSVLPEDSDISD